MHHSELQVITAPLLISTIHRTPQHPLSLLPACCIFNSRFLSTDCNSGYSSASRAQVLLTQPPMQSSIPLPTFNWTGHVRVEVTLRLTVSQSVRLGLLLFDSYGLVLWGALSDERTGLFLYMLLVLASVVFSGSGLLALVTLIYCLRFEIFLLVVSYDSQGSHPPQHGCDLVKITPRRGPHRKHRSIV
jgi:hypothetical protein